MITHYVVEFDHEKNEWRVGDDSTVWFIADTVGGLTWKDNEVDWLSLSEAEMVLLRADLAWRLNRKDYLND